MFPFGNTVFFRNVQANDAGDIILTVTNLYGTVSEVVATLEVVDRAPEILIQPQDQLYAFGEPTSLSVTAVGTEPLYYQWFQNDQPVQNATNAGIVITAMSPTSAGSYYATISNRIGSTTSMVAVVSSNVSATIDWPTIGLQPVLTNNVMMTDIAHAGDGSERIFVLEVRGQVRVFRKGVGMNVEPFLSITNNVLAGGERGLLGIAFDPEFKSNGEFYVYYTRRPDGATVLSRFTAVAEQDVVDPSTEEILLAIPHPSALHNGGDIAFGPDGYLYIATGDAALPFSPAQDTNLLLGKVLRIDVSGSSSNYAIPPTNPFVDQPGYLPEIWALGLRNPWRFDFDRLTGDLYLPDVGERTFEEINFQPANSAGGVNYGWPVFEAHLWTRLRATNTNHFVFPIASLPRSSSIALIGGKMHRGPLGDRLFGSFYSADYGNGRMWALRRVGTNWGNTLVAEGGLPVTTFGDDEEGNLYVAQQPRSGVASDGIYRVSQLFDTFRALPPTLSPAARTFNSAIQVTLTSPTPGAIIHYTLDGSDPTETSPFVESAGVVNITRTTTLKAAARRPGLYLSTVATGNFTAQLALTVSPSGSLTNGTLVQILPSNGSADIWFTLDGSTPTTNSTKYTGEFAIQGNQTVRAIATSDGWVSGSVDRFIGLLAPEPAVIQRIAGTGEPGTNDGPRTLARFHTPLGIAVAKDGTVHVADSANKRIRIISKQGDVSTLASGFIDPVGVAISSSGNTFVADRGADRIFEVTPTGEVMPYAGSGIDGIVDGPGETAQFRALSYMEVDAEGYLYVIDWGSLRRISPTKNVTTLPMSFPSYYGFALGPTNIFTVTPEGLVYKVNESGQQDVHAGKLAIGDHSDGEALTAQFLDYFSILSQLPRDIVSGQPGHLYLVDGPVIRHIHPDASVTTLMESPQYPPTNLTYYTTGMAIAPDGSLYVSDIGAHSVFRVSHDSDRDSVPDPDEVNPFQIGVDDRLVDSDGDGVSNAAEYHAGTDPKLNNQAVVIQASLSGQDIVIGWTTERNGTARIQKSLDLNTWLDLTPTEGSAANPTLLPNEGLNQYFRVLFD
jgi:glucose/arabinose dehydrogenase